MPFQSELRGCQARPDQTRPGQSKRWQSVESKDVILKCYSLHYKQRWGWGDMVGGPGHRVGCFCVHQFSIWMLLLLLLLIRRNETAEKKLNFLSFSFPFPPYLLLPVCIQYCDCTAAALNTGPKNMKQAVTTRIPCPTALSPLTLLGLWGFSCTVNE